MTVDEIKIDEEVGEISRILSDHERNKGILIHALQLIQKDNGCLPGDVLTSH